MTDKSRTHLFSPRTIICGIGTLNSVVEEIRKLGGTKVLVVTDPGIREAGLTNRLLDVINNGEISVDLFDNVNPDPELAKVEACVALLRKEGHDLVIGFGGGSPIDVAKYSAALVGHPGSVRDYLGRHMLTGSGLPKLMIPTTAGTGSEVTWAAVFHDEIDHVKKAVWSPCVQADSVIVDPSLTVSMPLELTIDTGMDTLIHCIEACVATEANPITDSLALRAITLIRRGFRRVVKNGNNLEARHDMSLAAMMAGLAFCNAGLGAIHALALLLDAEYGFTHGRSLTVLAPHVMDFNLNAEPGKYAEIAIALGEKTEGLDEVSSAQKAVDGVITLAGDIEVPMRLRDYGVREDKIEEMGKRAFDVGQRLLHMNPRTLDQDQAVEIYRKAF